MSFFHHLGIGKRAFICRTGLSTHYCINLYTRYCGILLWYRNGQSNILYTSCPILRHVLFVLQSRTFTMMTLIIREITYHSVSAPRLTQTQPQSPVPPPRGTLLQCPAPPHIEVLMTQITVSKERPFGLKSAILHVISSIWTYNYEQLRFCQTTDKSLSCFHTNMCL